MKHILILLILSGTIASCDPSTNPHDSDDSPANPANPGADSPELFRPTAMIVENVPFPCDATRLGSLVFLKGQGFLHCESDGQWHSIDLTGPEGKEGPAGPKGDTGAPGVAGLSGDAGPKGDRGPEGATGPAGSPGAKGDQGVTGNVGPQGGSSIIAVYDAANRKLGWMKENEGTTMARFLVMLTSGQTITINAMGLAYTDLGRQSRTNLEYNHDPCYFTTSDCSGICYTSLPYVFAHLVSPDVIGYFTKTLGVSDGVKLAGFTSNSQRHYSSGICYTSIVNLSQSYATYPLILASGAAYPFQGPLILKGESSLYGIES